MSGGPRHEAREAALQILYQIDVGVPAGAPQPEAASDAELAARIASHFDHFSVSQSSREFAARLVAGTLRARGDLDAAIEARASNWKVSRMPPIDRSLLRMAAYELRHCADVPTGVVIDEAIELAKKFGAAETPAFVNGLLDALKADLRPAI